MRSQSRAWRSPGTKSPAARSPPNRTSCGFTRKRRRPAPREAGLPLSCQLLAAKRKVLCAIREPLGVITGVIKLVALPAGGVRGLCERAQLGLLRLVLGLVGG